MRVITTMLCSAVDPQRGYKWPAEFSRYLPWARSVRARGHTPIVLTDCGRGYDGLDVVQVPPGENPYFHRWRVVADYLQGVYSELVWVTDGTDVLMLRDPLPSMNRDRLYIADDVYPIGCLWMRKTCPGYAGWIDENADRMLMNAGVLGGPLGAVRYIAETIADQWPVDAVHDMAAFNQTVIDTGWAIHVGAPVNTVMHDYDHAHPTAWFAHK